MNDEVILGCEAIELLKALGLTGEKITSLELDFSVEQDVLTTTRIDGHNQTTESFHLMDKDKVNKLIDALGLEKCVTLKIRIALDEMVMITSEVFCNQAKLSNMATALDGVELKQLDSRRLPWTLEPRTDKFCYDVTHLESTSREWELAE